MVAVLTVFANHLWGQPTGGFIGVDVFFVVSGFLITGNLLRDAEIRGSVSFRRFYWNRLRRILPAATLVLIVTYIASVILFQPFRAEQVGYDALWAFFFVANWHFAVQDTDYFAQSSAVSPLQHYWSLSIEEQFYFVWPALILLVSAVVVRRTWTHNHRMMLAGATMGVIAATSLGWALYESVEAPTWAYFNTFARVWELGVGAVLACLIGYLARIPERVRPALSWLGLGLIAASVFLISENSVGFPAPWAVLPVTGAALVIAAGVGGEPRYQPFLRNPVSGYIGDISYSLYLVHWPVIVILGSLIETRGYYSVAVAATAFGLAIASYHFVENPLRKADWGKVRSAAKARREWQYSSRPASRYAAVASLVLVTVGASTYALQPYPQPSAPPEISVAQSSDTTQSVAQDPFAADLRAEIIAALKATEWPPLTPTIEQAIDGPAAPDEVRRCAIMGANSDGCTWGSPDAPTKIVLVGDSIGMFYGGVLRQLADNSRGQIQVHLEIAGGCQFSQLAIAADIDEINSACSARKQRAVDYINATNPTVVMITNSYGDKHLVGGGGEITPQQWADGMTSIVDKFRANTEKVVWLAAPPADKDIVECYDRSSTPADCISEVNQQWLQTAEAARAVAAAQNGAWIDSRRWFCVQDLCPAFVGSTPVKLDNRHVTISYAEKITPGIENSLRAAGVL